MIAKQAILSALLTDEGWQRYGELFTASFWGSDIAEDIYRAIESFWSKSDTATTLDVPTLEGLLEVRHDAEDLPARIRYLRQVAKIPAGRADVVVQEALATWSTQQIIHDLAAQVGAGTFSAADAAMRFDMLARAQMREHYESPADSIRQVLAVESAIDAYPTGLEKLDAALEGGLWEGEIGIFVGPSRRGKTHKLVSAGAAALRADHPVQHHTFEISRRRTAIRYYQNLLELSRKKVLAHPVKAARGIAELELPAWEIIDHSGSYTTTAEVRQEIRRFSEQAARTGAKRPLILVDYIDLVKSAQGNHAEGRFALNAIVRALREAASRYQVGIWTASQSNRATYRQSHVRMDQVAESIGKIEVADVVIILNQGSGEKGLGVMRLFVDKARERGHEGTEVYVRALTETQSFSDDLEELEELYGE